MKEVNTIARTLNIDIGRGGGIVTLFVIAIDSCCKVVRLELGYTVGINHPQLMKIVPSTIFCVHDPRVGFSHGLVQFERTIAIPIR